MSYIKNTVLLVLLFLFSIICVNGQKEAVNENLVNFLKIKLFINNREDVERLYGKGEKGLHNEYIVGYQTPDGYLQIEYSSGNCKSLTTDYWNVPEWTVIDLDYSFNTDKKKPPELEKLIPKRSHYKKRQSGHLPDVYEFYNEQKGVIIFYDGDVKEVDGIKLFPTTEEIQKYKCNPSENN